MAPTKTVHPLAKSANRLDRVKEIVRLYPYRFLAGLVVAAALLLTMTTPQDLLRLQMPEPWSYQLAAENFVQGKWTLTTNEVAAARTQVRTQGSRLTQYIEIAPDVWAFRQSPGLPLQLAFFQTVAGQPRLANISLALAAALIVYTLLSLWFNEKAALIGVTLLLWTPISLLALHYTLMDTFSGGMWPLIAGGLLLIFAQVERNARPVWPWAILFLAGFAAGWSVVVRITSLPLAFVLAGYGLYLIWVKHPLPPVKRARRKRKKKQKRPLRLDNIGVRQLMALVLGGGLALAILLTYNWLTFGKLLDNGYLYPSNYEAHNLWSDAPLTEVPGGVQTWLAGGTVADMIVTLFVHIRLWLRPATWAWPLWPLALWALYKLLRQKQEQRATWFILIWLLVAYAPFAGIVFFGVTRALAVPYDQGWGYFVPSRYIYTMILPFVWCLSWLMVRWPNRWLFGLLSLYVVGSGWLFMATLAH